MYVVGVHARRVTARGERSPARGWQPHLSIPDHVQDPEPVRVVDQEGGQAVAVRPVLPGRVTTRADREVAGSTLRVLPAVVVGAETGHARVEPGRDGLVAGVRGARCDAATGDRLVHRAALGRPASVGVARRGGGDDLAVLVE